MTSMSSKHLLLILQSLLIWHVQANNTVLETSQILVTPDEKLNFDLSNIRSLEEATYKITSDIENIRTTQFESLNTIDLKTRYQIDFDFDPKDVKSLTFQNFSVYFIVNQTLYVLFEEQSKYVSQEKCSLFYVANHFIFCFDTSGISDTQNSKIPVTVLQNKFPLTILTQYDIEYTRNVVRDVQAFEYFKNEDDGFVMTIITQKDSLSDKEFYLNYYAYERDLKKIQFEVEFPEAKVLEANYINTQILLVSEKYLTTVRVKDQMPTHLTYVYSFSEDSLTNCNFDNSDASNMVLTCATNTFGKILKFLFLKSNFLINSMSTSSLNVPLSSDYLKTIIMYKYIYIVFETYIKVYSANNFEFHARSPTVIDLSDLELDPDPIKNTIGFFVSSSEFSYLQIFSHLQAICESFTAGSYLQVEYQDESRGIQKTVRFDLQVVPPDEDFHVLFDAETLPDISFNAKNLNFEIPPNLALGSDLNNYLVINEKTSLRYIKLDKDYKFDFNSNFNPSLSEFTKFLFHELNGVPMLTLITQTNSKLSIFQCRLSKTIRCRLTLELKMLKGELLQYTNFKANSLNSNSIIMLLSDRRVGVGNIDDLSGFKWTDMGSNLGLHSCTSPDQSNIFCICEKDNFVRKIMISNTLGVSMVSLPEMELAKALFSTPLFSDLVFIQTIEGITVFNFKLKKVKFTITNAITKNDKDFFLKISETYIVFLSKVINCFLFYDLREFYQGNTPKPRFKSCVPFPAGYKLSNFTVNNQFSDSKMPLILHDSTTNYLLMYDLSRPAMDLLFFVESISPRNKLELIYYQIHPQLSQPNFYFVTVSNPSYSDNPLLALRVNFSKRIQTSLSLDQQVFSTKFRIVSGLDSKNQKDYSLNLQRQKNTVDIKTFSQKLDKFNKDRFNLDYTNLYSINSLEFSLQLPSDESLNDFLNKFSVSPSLLYNHSFLQALNLRNFSLQSQVFLPIQSLLIILTRDSLLYFRYKDNRFNLLNIISLKDFFAFDAINCLFIQVDSKSNLHVLCDDSQTFQIIQFSLSNIFLPSTQTNLFNSQKNFVSGFYPLSSDRLLLFISDSGVNQTKFSTKSRETRSFYVVYDCAKSKPSPKLDLPQSTSDFLGFHSINGQINFFFKQLISPLPHDDIIPQNKGINLYFLDDSTDHLKFQKTIIINRAVKRLKKIMLTPDESNIILIYRTNQIGVVDSQSFLQNKFQIREIPNYDNFEIHHCVFEESEKQDQPYLLCFQLQSDTSPKENPINSLILSFNLFPELKNPQPLDYFNQFYPMKINQETGLQTIEMLLIKNPSNLNSKERYLILRIGTSIYDIFNLDRRVLMIKNDMVKNVLRFSASSPYTRVTNTLVINPKYNIKTMILFFSIGFGFIMLVLFFCHFKFMKDSILNKYKRFKIDEMNTILDEGEEEEKEKEIIEKSESVTSLDEIK